MCSLHVSEKDDIKAQEYSFGANVQVWKWYDISKQAAHFD